MGKFLISDELKRIINDIAEVAGYVWERGWSVKNGGNLSVDVTGLVPIDKLSLSLFPCVNAKIPAAELAGRYFLIKITGFRFRDLSRNPEKGLLLIGISEKENSYYYLWGGDGPQSKPTAEFIPHMKIHAFLRRNKLPQKAVLHTHPNHLIALTHMDDYGRESFNRFLTATHVGAKFFLPEGVGMVPFHRGGSDELANDTVRLLARHKAVLWEKHGCTATGTDIFDAFDYIDLLDATARVFFICKSAGYEPKPLTEEELAELKQAPI
jgi:rhamnulose-1-phosphate aldolase